MDGGSQVDADSIPKGEFSRAHRYLPRTDVHALAPIASDIRKSAVKNIRTLRSCLRIGFSKSARR